MKPKTSLKLYIQITSTFIIVLFAGMSLSSCTSCTQEVKKPEEMMAEPKTKIEQKVLEKGVKSLTPGEKEKYEEHQAADKYLYGPHVKNAEEFYFPQIKEGAPGGELKKDKVKDAKFKTLKDGLKYMDLEEGFGIVPEPGGRCLIHYTCWLSDGSQVISSIGKLPIKFKYGKSEVIRGLDEGVTGLKVGGVRKLIVPPELAYGEKGNSKIGVPPGETITIVLKLLSAGK